MGSKGKFSLTSIIENHLAQGRGSCFVVVPHHLAVDGFSALTRALLDDSDHPVSMLVLSHADVIKARVEGIPESLISSLEGFARNGVDAPEMLTLDELRRRYLEVPWAAVIASERSFTDYSFLQGGTGHRPERDDYIVPLILRIVTFFEQAYLSLQPQAVITSFGDNIFNYIATIVAEELHIPVIMPQPSFLNEGGVMESGFLGSTRYMESFSMIRRYQELRKRALTAVERQRAEAFSCVLKEYEGQRTLDYIYKEKDYEKPISPQCNRIVAYLKEQRRLDSDIAFYKIAAWRKVRANLTRIYRLRQLRKFLASQPEAGLGEFVFFAMHFQPEASTLVNGIWYANQIALIETLSKSIPLGFTLVVKDHPRGRGTRPLWQYKHIVDLHNVILSDLPSKELVRRSRMVVSVSGSVGFEALALDKPVLVLGRTFHTFNTLYYRIRSVEDLPSLFNRVLIHGEFEKLEERQEEVYRFFLAYLDSLYPFFPIGKQMAKLVPYILDDIASDREAPKAWLSGTPDGI